MNDVENLMRLRFAENAAVLSRSQNGRNALRRALAWLEDDSTILAKHEAGDLMSLLAAGLFDMRAAARDAVKSQLGESPEPQPARSVNADLLQSLCDLIAIASPDDAADDEEREAYRRAVAAKKAASVPCPLCTTAEQLCEACGGHGVIPKDAAKPKVLITVAGGCADFVYEGEVVVGILDYDDVDAMEDGEKYQIDSAFRSMVANLDVDVNALEFV